MVGCLLAVLLKRGVLMRFWNAYAAATPHLFNPDLNDICIVGRRWFEISRRYRTRHRTSSLL
jgi:hypothetical protein